MVATVASILLGSCLHPERTMRSRRRCAAASARSTCDMAMSTARVSHKLTHSQHMNKKHLIHKDNECPVNSGQVRFVPSAAESGLVVSLFDFKDVRERIRTKQFSHINP